MESHASVMSIQPSRDLRLSRAETCCAGETDGSLQAGEEQRATETVDEEKDGDKEVPRPLCSFQPYNDDTFVVSLRTATAGERALLMNDSGFGGVAASRALSLAENDGATNRPATDAAAASAGGCLSPTGHQPSARTAAPHQSRGSSPNGSFVGNQEADGEAERRRQNELHSPFRGAKRERFEHEQDHDSCPFMTIRKSEWFIMFLDHIRRTSPMDPNKLLASFSVKNDFMFYPPPKTYRFLHDESGNITVGESNELADSGDDEARLRKEQQHLVTRKVANRRRADYEAPPELDPRKQIGATHGISGLGTYMTPSGRRSKFEMLFIPWENEVQSYRIEKDEVILERKLVIGGSLFSCSLGCPIPCSIIRPNCRMSSHVAIFFHCNGEDIGHSSCMRLQTLANALHVTVLVPEYPGYGLFRGRTSEASVKGAMERIVQFLLSVDANLTPSRLLLIGHSIGGAVAVHIASYIQEIFERMQAHYQNDVACPGAYSNDLAHSGKPTFFEAFQIPSRTAGETSARQTPRKAEGHDQQASYHPQQRQQPHEQRRADVLHSASFADDDADDDEILARRGAEEQRQAGWSAATQEGDKPSSSAPIRSSTSIATQVPFYSPPVPSVDVPRLVGTRASKHEPFGSENDKRGGTAGTSSVGANREVVSAQREEVIPERGDSASPKRSEKRRYEALYSSSLEGNRGEEEEVGAREPIRGGGIGATRYHIASDASTSTRTLSLSVEQDSRGGPSGKKRKVHPFRLPCGGGDSESDYEGEQREGCCSCCGCFGHRARVRQSTVTHCRHNALGGIILISTFTALRCLEYVPTFKRTYNLHTTQLEVRRRQVLADTVFPAPVDWCKDASVRVPPEEMHFSYDELTTPLAFKLSRFLSFNRFPTVDAMCQLQEKYQYFNHTPLLLIHGIDDELISPIHSVAMATKVRQCKNGGPTARVFMSFLTGGGHNELPCIREIRRFYKDQILKPHLQRQQRFNKKLTELYNSGCGQHPPHTREGVSVPRPPSTLRDSESGKGDSRTESRADTAPPPPPPTELYFLSRDPTLSTRFEDLARITSGNSPSSFAHHHHAHYRSQAQHSNAPDDDNLTSGLITREISTHESQLPGADHALRSRTNTGVAVREREVYGPFIHRELSTFTDHDEPGSVVKNSSLLHTLEQTQSARDRPEDAVFAPAATVLHMSMFPMLEKYDVGSVLVAAVRANALPKDVASALYMRHYHLAWAWRILVASVVLLASMMALAVGITHAVLCRERRIREVLPPGHTVSEYKRDNRILAWSVLEATFLAIIFFVRLLTPMYGLANVSKERERHSRLSFKIFGAVRLIAVALVIGSGILMGFILAFTPHERGGVHWAKWSSLPYRRKVWISFLPRWAMVAVGIWHCVVLVFVVAKNH